MTKQMMHKQMMHKAAILVVEDEILIRMNTADMIEEAGYDVVEARDARAALDILKQRDDIDVVFTDVNMPGTMDGLELARFICGTWPWIHVVITSGKMMLRDEDIPDEGRFLPKPYNSRQLTHVLHELVG
jgi:CheY-like chemotaxis protein